ncbi:MAG: ABC transporter substrate-binding protein [Lachnospiraceae bacterium]|nr:ABC transporter substrate-binding protein [Lachnospiraceae bacterium]
MKKILAMLLALVLALSMLSACGGNGGEGGNKSSDAGQDTQKEAESKDGEKAQSVEELLAALPETLRDGEVVGIPEMYPTVDMSKPYTVHLYNIGDKPNDWDDIEAKINERLAPFNTKVENTFISWGDAGTMYSLVLAGGEDIDAIHTATWNNMWTEGLKGSFFTIDDAFLQEFMPLTWKYQDHVSFSQTKLNGKMVAIPCNKQQPENKIVAIRQDLAEKYGITELKNWDDYMNFMLTIAEKETPESGIFAQASSGNNSEVQEVYFQQFDTFELIKDNNMNFIFYYNGGVPEWEDIKFLYETDEYKDYIHDMKTQADAGCWSRGALNGTISDDDAFSNLQGASIAWNAAVFNGCRNAEKTEGVRCAAYDLTTDHLVTCEDFNNNDVGIAAASKDPQRTAMVLDLLKMDTELNKLIMMGIEGVHYEMESDGVHYHLLEPKSDDYPGISLSWSLKNDVFERTGVEEREQKMVDEWRKRIQSNPCITFVFNDENITQYTDAVKSIIAEYVPSLQLGLYEDPDAMLNEMMERCNNAGLPQIKEEVERQFKEWKATL